MHRTPWLRVLPRSLGWYFLVLFWEGLTIPAVSHSDSWRGVWVSVLVLPFGAFRLARHGARGGTLFVFGSAGALLFVPRFLMMDRFSLWLQYQAPSDIVIVFSWIAFTLIIGSVCAFTGSLDSVPNEKSKSDGAKRF